MIHILQILIYFKIFLKFVLSRSKLKVFVVSQVPLKQCRY